MQIERLTIKNFMCYEDASLVLKDRGLILVEGENQDEGGSNGAGKSSIFEALCWCLFGHTLRGLRADEVCREGQEGTQVHVTLKLDGDRTVILSRYRNDKRFGNNLRLSVNDNDITASSDRETQVRVNDLLQLDWETFISVVLFPQGVHGFASYTDAEQKAVLERVLGMERFTKAQERAKGYRDLLMTSRDKIQVALAGLKARKNDAENNHNRLIDGEKHFFEDQQRNVEDFQKKVAQHETRRPEVNTAAIRTKEDLERRLIELTPSQIRDLDNQAQSRLDTVNRSLSELTGQKKVMQRSIDSLKSTFPLVTPIPSKISVDVLSTRVYDLREYEQTVRSAKAVAASGVSSTCDRRRVVYDQLEGRALMIGKACPTCGQTLTREAATAVNASLQSRYDDLTELKKDKEIELEKKVLEYEKTIARRVVWEARLASAKCSAALIETVRKMTAQGTELADLSLRQISLQHDLGTYTNAKNDIADRLKEIAVVEQELQKVKDNINRQQTEFNQWSTEKASLQRQLQAEAAKPSPFTTLIADSKKLYKEIVSQVGMKELELASTSEEIEYFKFWVEGFSNRGVKSLLLDVTIPVLNESAGRYLSFLSNGAATISFATQTTLTSGETRDKFHVRVGYRTGSGSYKGLSGGEQRRADIAVLFALGDLAATRAHTPIQLRLLDEPFESLDALGCEQVVELLKREIVPGTGTVLVMSHNEALKQLFDQRITVQKSQGVSSLVER